MSGPYTVTTQPGGYPPQSPGPMYPSPDTVTTQPGGYPPQAPGPMYPSPGMPGDGYMGSGAPGQPGFAQPMYPQPGMYGAAGQPIAMQPIPGGPGVNPAGWMPAPTVPANCPRGLEYLSQVDQLLVKQKIEVLEAFTGFETNNKYEVLNSMGQKVYYAVEVVFHMYGMDEQRAKVAGMPCYTSIGVVSFHLTGLKWDTCCASRNFCGSVRPFDIKIFDNQRQEVMHLDRPLRCSHCLCFCCLQKMEVQAPPGTPIGYVRQAWSLCWPKYKLNNEHDETVLLIKGPCCRIDICGDLDFKITSPDEKTCVGKITKQWSGMAKEVFTDADNFGVVFPVDLDVKAKATALGAVFLIDFMYFEDGGSKNDH